MFTEKDPSQKKRKQSVPNVSSEFLPEAMPQLQLTGTLRKETMLRDRYHQEKKINELKVQQMEEEMIQLKKQMKGMIEKCKKQIQGMMEENQSLKQQNHQLHRITHHNHAQHRTQLNQLPPHQPEQPQQPPYQQIQQQSQPLKLEEETFIEVNEEEVTLLSPASAANGLLNKISKNIKILTVPEALEEAAAIRSLSPTKQQKLHDFLQQLLSPPPSTSPAKTSSSLLPAKVTANSSVPVTQSAVKREKLTLSELEPATPTVYNLPPDLVKKTHGEEEEQNPFARLEEEREEEGDDENDSQRDGNSSLFASMIHETTSTDTENKANNNNTPSNLNQANTPSSALTDNSMDNHNSNHSENNNNRLYISSSVSTSQITPNKAPSSDTATNIISPFIVPEAIFSTLQNQDTHNTNNSSSNITIGTTSSTSYSTSPARRAIDFTDEKKKSEKECDKDEVLNLQVKNMIQRIEERVKTPTSTAVNANNTRSALKEKNHNSTAKNGNRSRSATPNKDNLKPGAATTSAKKKDMKAMALFFPDEIPTNTMITSSATAILDENGNNTAISKKLFEHDPMIIPSESNHNQIEVRHMTMIAAEQITLQTLQTLPSHLPSKIPTMKKKSTILTEERGIVTSPWPQPSSSQLKQEKEEQEEERLAIQKKQEETDRLLSFYSSEVDMMRERYSQAIITLTTSTTQQKQHNFYLTQQNQHLLTAIDEKHSMLTDYQQSLEKKEEEQVILSNRIEQLEAVTHQIYSEKKVMEVREQQLLALKGRLEQEKRKAEEELERVNESHSEDSDRMIGTMKEQQRRVNDLQEELSMMQEKYSSLQDELSEAVNEANKANGLKVILTKEEASISTQTDKQEEEQREEAVIVHRTETMTKEVMTDLDKIIVMTENESNTDSSLTLITSYEEKRQFEQEINTLQERVHTLKIKFKHHSNTLKERIKRLEAENNGLEEEKAKNERILMNYEEILFSPSAATTQQGEEKEEVKGDDERALKERRVKELMMVLDSESLESFVNKTIGINEVTSSFPSEDTMTMMSPDPEILSVDNNHSNNNDNTMNNDYTKNSDNNLPMSAYTAQIESLQLEINQLKTTMKQRSSKAINKMKSLFQEITSKSQQLENQLQTMQELESMIHATRYENSSLKNEIHKLTSEIQTMHNNYHQQINHLKGENEKKHLEMNKITMILEKERLQMKVIQQSMDLLNRKKEKLNNKLSSSTNSSASNSTMNSRATSPLNQNSVMSFSHISSSGILSTNNNNNNSNNNNSQSLLQPGSEGGGSVVGGVLLLSSLFSSLSLSPSSSSAAPTTAPVNQATSLMTSSTDNNEERVACDDNEREVAMNIHELTEESNTQINTNTSFSSFHHNHHNHHSHHNTHHSKRSDGFSSLTDLSVVMEEPFKEEELTEEEDTENTATYEGLKHSHHELLTVNEQFEESFHLIQNNLQETLQQLQQENHHITDYIQKRATEHNNNQQRRTMMSPNSMKKEDDEYEAVDGSYRTCIQDYNNQINSISLTLFERIKLLYKENEAKDDEIEGLKKQQDQSNQTISELQEKILQMEAMMKAMTKKEADDREVKQEVAMVEDNCSGESSKKMEEANNDEDDNNDNDNNNSHAHLQFLYHD